MKKIIACTSLLILALSISCSALAWVTPTDAVWLNISNVQCVNTTTLKYWDYNSDLSNPSDQLPYKSYANNFYGTGINTAYRLYVYHTITGGGGNAYTNLFHAVRLDSGSYEDPEGGTLCGTKWVTPSQWIAIQSNAIYDDRLYSVAVRGNTKHHENYGATSINFRIGIEANQ